MTCDELRAIADDLALDDVTGEARAAALGHLAACDTCRALVAELALVADAVLLAAPEHEPPTGFESRVLHRMQPTTARRSPRRWVVAAIAAAVVALAVGVGVGAVVAERDDNGGRAAPVAALLTSVSSGRVGGTVVLADAPDRMTCTFEDSAFGGTYSVDVRLRDGSTTTVGRFEADGVPWSWTVPLPVDVQDVLAVVVRSGDGVVRLTAELD
jgi:hypothetical protein